MKTINTPLLAPVALALALAWGGGAHAQSGAPCPRLDATSGLGWEHSAGPGFDFCRALDDQGRQVLGVYVGADSPFEPKRRNRAEKGAIDGRPIIWYRGELAGDPEAQVRETLLQLPDGRVAHVWLRANNADELVRDLKLAEGMSFQPVQLSGP